MEECLISSANLAYLLKWLENTDFIIDMNNTAYKGVWSHGRLQLFKIDESSGKLHGKIGYFKAHILKSTARVKNALVFNLSGDNMLSLISVELSNTLKA